MDNGDRIAIVVFLAMFFAFGVGLGASIISGSNKENLTKYIHGEPYCFEVEEHKVKHKHCYKFVELTDD